MNQKFVETALSQIAIRTDRLAAAQKILQSLDTIPVSVRSEFEQSVEAQGQVITELGKISKELQDKTESLLEAWLLNLGFVFQEMAQFTLKNQECEYDEYLGPKLSPTGQDIGHWKEHKFIVSEARITGSIAALRLSHSRKNLTMLLSEWKILNFDGSHASSPATRLNTQVSYLLRGTHRDALTVRHGADGLEVVLPLRQANHIFFDLSKG